VPERRRQPGELVVAGVAVISEGIHVRVFVARRALRRLGTHLFLGIVADHAFQAVVRPAEGKLAEVVESRLGRARLGSERLRAVAALTSGAERTVVNVAVAEGALHRRELVFKVQVALVALVLYVRAVEAELRLPVMVERNIVVSDR